MITHQVVIRVGTALLAAGACAMVFLLVGCASPAAVPVAVRCVDEIPVRPVYRTKTLPADATDADKVKAVSLDWLDSRPYEAQLEAGLEACR